MGGGGDLSLFCKGDSGHSCKVEFLTDLKFPELELCLYT